jgi:hypothetical protein
MPSHGLKLDDMVVEEGVSGSVPVAERPAGGPLAAPFGYRVGEAGELTAHEGEQKAIREMKRIRAQGKLTDLLQELAGCPKARSASIHDRCKAIYGQRLP